MEQGREAHCSAEETLSDDYVMMMTLGQGKFSEVQLAFHLPTVTCVVVKILRNKKKYASFIKNEVSILKSVAHANIIKLFQVVQTRETTYLVMEHASEGDLFHHILKLGSLEESEVRRLFIQILHAVQYCHENSIAHRDIKAGNILLDHRGNAKLSNFGLSAKVIPGQKFSGFRGTLYYCAPELFGKEAYDGLATDIWSLGVLLFLMVAGYFPFRATAGAGVKQHILAANFKVPRHVSIDIFNVIVELLIINPGRRPTIGQIMRRPMVRSSAVRSPPTSTQSLPGTLSPTIVRTMTVLGYKYEEIVESLRAQKYNQVMATYLILQHHLPGGDCYYYEEKPVRAMEPGLVLNPADLHTFPESLGRPTKPAPPTFTLPSKTKEKDEKNVRQAGTRHSMPAALCCQSKRMHPHHLPHLGCPVADCFTSSSLDSIEYFTHSKIGSFGGPMASVQPPLFPDTSSPTPHQSETTGDTDNIMSPCSPQEELWSSQEASQYFTPTGSSSSDTLQEETVTQDEAITHEATLTQDDVISNEWNMTQDDIITHVATLTQDETFTQETIWTQDEDITDDATLTQDEVITQETTLTQNENATQETTVTQEGTLTQDEAITHDAILTQDKANIQESILTQDEAMNTHETTLMQEGTMTQNEAITHDATWTQDEVITQETTLTQDEAKTHDATLTHDEAITQKTTLTQNEAITQETTMTHEGTMTQDEAITHDSTLTQNEVITLETTLNQEETMTQEGTMTQDEAIIHGATLTQDEAITQETTMTQEGTMTQDEAITHDATLTQKEVITKESTLTHNEAFTHDTTLNQAMTMSHEGTMMQDETTSQEAIMTQEGTIMVVEAIIQDETITPEATMTQVETITQEEAITLDVAMTQEVIITHGQPNDAGPASSRTRRHPSWKGVKKTIMNCFRNRCCCCLPPAERGHASCKNLAPKGRDHGVTPRTSPEEVKPQLHGL